jgi:hypothetical protein
MRQLEKDAAAYRGRSHAEFGWGGGPVWISALIDDGDIAAAWDAAAGIASARQWLALADLVGVDRPGDALPVYLRAVEPLRSQTGDSVYAQVTDLLVKIRAVTNGWARVLSSPPTRPGCALTRSASVT